MRTNALPLLAVILTACGDPSPTEPRMMSAAPTSFSRGSDDHNSVDHTDGIVFTLTNSATENAVLAYTRDDGGSVTLAGRFPTGGRGTGAGLGSQGALALSSNGKLLIAVNAGSNEITSFRARSRSLERVSTVSSGGTHPISVTIDRNIVYVVNDGASGNIAGFVVDHDGRLRMIPGSIRSLSSSASGPAQIGFALGGDVLVVTEKNTNVISSYRVTHGGLTSGRTVTPSVGLTPFGFAFGEHGTLIVSDAFGGAVDASAATSYRVSESGALSFVSGPIATTETAACWFAVTNDGKFAYTTNTGSASVSGYRVSARGELTLLDADGRTGVTGTTPTDVALSGNSKYLYTLNAGSRDISAFVVRGDGSLSRLSQIGGLPAGTVGLVAR